MTFSRRLVLSGLLLITLAGLGACAQTRSFGPEAPEIAWDQAHKRILLMPAEIQLSLLTAGGLLEPRADWTEAARSHVREHLDGFFAGRGIDAVYYDEQTSLLENPRDDQLVKLYGAVGRSILIHEYASQPRLPHKSGAFDWTLGAGMQPIGERFQSDYALFVYMEDSFSSGGRAAMMVFGALLGVGIPGGTQVAFASLVDTRSGDIAWFNVLIDTTGDLRTSEGAARAIDNLLRDLPL